MSYSKLECDNYKICPNSNNKCIIIKKNMKDYKCYMVDQTNMENMNSTSNLVVTCSLKNNTSVLYNVKKLPYCNSSSSAPYELISMGKITSKNTATNILKNHKQFEFKVNNDTIISFKIASPYFTSYNIDQYEIDIHNNQYNIQEPRIKNNIYVLSYRLIKTKLNGKNIGIESKRNFALNDAENNRRFECLRLSKNKMVVGYKDPLDYIIASAIGIMRFSK